MVLSCAIIAEAAPQSFCATFEESYFCTCASSLAIAVPEVLMLSSHVSALC